MTLTRAQLARLVDHTLLTPTATSADVDALVREAQALGVRTVCVAPSRLPVRTDLPVTTVCGFPTGAHTPAAKAAEAAESVHLGAAEIDMVLDLGAVADGRFEHVRADIEAVREVTRDVVLKVIVESAALTDEQLVGCCAAAMAAGADMVKTSTGMHPAGGASVHAVQVMRATVGDRLGIKASGGIRDAASALALLDAGATRLGLSATRAVLDGLA